MDFGVKVVGLPEADTSVEMYLLDSGGQSVFNQREHGTKYWQGASVMALVYDVSSHQSFQSCAKWIAAVRSTHEGRPIPGVLIANKIDLREQGRMEVSQQEGEQFAQENGLTYFECSAVSVERCGGTKKKTCITHAKISCAAAKPGRGEAFSVYCGCVLHQVQGNFRKLARRCVINLRDETSNR